MKRNKLYTKREPDKEGKLYFIFCEGEKRETTYFYFFNRLASQIIIQIVPIENGRNSPMGLYRNACSLIKDGNNPNPPYELHDLDEVWFIIDTDKWEAQIDELRNCAAKRQNWFVAQSNPCFEIWLYYHFEKNKPAEFVTNWKAYLNDKIPGGFNPNKHPVHIQTAIVNSEKNFSASNDQPDPLTTEVYVLAKKILPLVKVDIDALLASEL
jgi:hypothetical protein